MYVAISLHRLKMDARLMTTLGCLQRLKTCNLLHPSAYKHSPNLEKQISLLCWCADLTGCTVAANTETSLWLNDLHPHPAGVSEVQHVRAAALLLAVIDPANWGYMRVLNTLLTFLKYSANKSRGQQPFINHLSNVNKYTYKIDR